MAKIIALSLGIVLILGSIGTAAYFYQKYKKAASEPGTAADDEVASITKKINQFMELPDETPTLATIADKEKLKDEVFFTNSQNGDKVLIYSKNKKAILYRPSTGKVIEVASLAGGDQNSSNAGEAGIQNQAVPEEQANNQVQSEPVAPAAAPEIPKVVKVAVYNGTNIKGLAKKIGDQLTALGNIEITKTDNAEGTFTESLIIDLSGGNDSAVDKIIQEIGGKKGELPASEARPEGDILVIAGGSQ
jgi:hypothetical protein